MPPKSLEQLPSLRPSLSSLFSVLCVCDSRVTEDLFWKVGFWLDKEEWVAVENLGYVDKQQERSYLSRLSVFRGPSL